MANKKITDFAITATVNNTDLVLLNRNYVTYNTAVDSLTSCISNFFIKPPSTASANQALMFDGVNWVAATL